MSAIPDLYDALITTMSTPNGAGDYVNDLTDRVFWGPDAGDDAVATGCRVWESTVTDGFEDVPLGSYNRTTQIEVEAWCPSSQDPLKRAKQGAILRNDLYLAIFDSHRVSGGALCTWQAAHGLSLRHLLIDSIATNGDEVGFAGTTRVYLRLRLAWKARRGH